MGDDALHVRHGAYLPHWTKAGATYAVTYRLSDSLPTTALEQIRRHRQALRAITDGREPTERDREQLKRAFSHDVEVYLDAGSGACVLRDRRAAAIVKESLEHFGGVRYQLFAWCIMPNHVHVLFRALGDCELPRILHTWKSYTVHEINKAIGRRGELWLSEYYDHMVRDADDFAHARQYILANPVTAGLREWPWVWAAEWDGGKCW